MTEPGGGSVRITRVPTGRIQLANISVLDECERGSFKQVQRCQVAQTDMDRTELIQYITEGIIDCLDRQPPEVAPLAADDVVQLAILREYFVSRNDPMSING
jgi:hypothetical protein